MKMNTLDGHLAQMTVDSALRLTGVADISTDDTTSECNPLPNWDKAFLA